MAKTRRSFDYSPDYDSTVSLAESRGGGYYNILVDGVKSFKPADGVNRIRMMPPTWTFPKPDHYGYAVVVHTEVGANSRTFLCTSPENNPTSPHKRCSICDALLRLGNRATQEDRMLLRGKQRYLYYMVDREAEKEGVQVWLTSSQNTSEIAVQSVDHRNKGVLNVSHPEKGYDLEFTKVGRGKLGTRYRGFMVSRESSPLSDSDKRYNDWLDYIEERPLPSLLKFYTPDFIEQVFRGQTADEDRSDDDDDRASSRRRSRDDEDEPPRRLRRTRDERDEEPDEDEQPTRRRARDEEPDDERPPARRRSRDDEDEPERPARRRAAARDEQDDDDGRPARRRAPAREADEDEPERPVRRRTAEASRDDDLARPAPRDALRRATSRDDEDEPERPARRRAVARDEQDEDDDPPPRRPRTRTEVELDDEIPFDGGRSAAASSDKGGVDEAERPATRTRQRTRLNDDVDKAADTATTTRRAAVARDEPDEDEDEDDEVEDERKPSRPRRSKPTGDTDEAVVSYAEMRSRARERMNRS